MCSALDLIEDWKVFLRNSFSHNTFESYVKDLLFFTNFIKSYKSKSELSGYDLTIIDLQGFREWLLFLYNKKKYSNRSRSRAISAVKSFLHFIKKKNFINKDIDYIKNPKLDKNIPRPIDLEEIKKLILHISNIKNNPPWVNLRNKIIILALYGSGLRISEALNIEYHDIYDSNIMILGKGKKQRSVPTLPVVIKLIDEYTAICPYDLKNKGKLFIGKYGKSLKRNYISNIIKRIREENSLSKNITPHSLRHSFATHLFNNGMDIRYIQKILGHKSLNSTQIYTKLDYKNLNDNYQKCHPRS